MAQCPKCGKKLTVFNVSQFCPECGVNLRFYDFENTFYREAKYAELSNAAVHVKIRRLKASFVGSKLTIIRIVSILFPLLALLLPAITFSLDLPFRSQELALSGLGLYGGFTDGSLMYFIGMKGSELYGGAFSLFFKSLILYGIAVLIGVALILMTILCFISVKNMQKITAVTAGAGVVFSLVSFFICGSFAAGCAGNPLVSAHRGIGFLITALMYLLVFIINLLLWVKGIPVEYYEGMEERLEIYRKLKRGEVNIDELPQPVVETAETRKIDEEIAKEKENLIKHRADQAREAEAQNTAEKEAPADEE